MGKVEFMCNTILRLEENAKSLLFAFLENDRTLTLCFHFATSFSTYLNRKIILAQQNKNSLRIYRNNTFIKLEIFSSNF